MVAVPRLQRPSPASSAPGIAIAATQNRRDYYDDGYGYYDAGPAYYGGGPAYYGGGPATMAAAAIAAACPTIAGIPSRAGNRDR